jgi:uncharacterized protein YkwD
MTRPHGSYARVGATAAVVLVSLLAQLAAQLGTADAAVARSAGGAYAQVAFESTNAARQRAGLDELAPQRCLAKAATSQAKAMAAQERMFHQDIRKLLAACGLSIVGENVAYGYPTGKSVVTDGWMKSAGHRANILNPRFTLMGIAARKGHDDRWYVSQVFGGKG